MAGPLQAAAITWANVGTDFEAGANWGGTAPANDTTTDVARFNSVVTNQPVLTVSRSIAGLDLSNTLPVAGGWNLSGAFTLTLGAGTADSGNFGIRSSNTSGVNTVSVSAIDLAASQSWSVANAAGVLLVSSQINGVSRSLTKEGAGELSLLGANTFNGGFMLNAGRVNIENASALGTGTFRIADGTVIGRRHDVALAPGTVAVSNAVTIEGNFTYRVSTSGTGTNNANVEFAGPVSLGTAAGTSRTFTIDNHASYIGSRLIISGTISDGTTATGLVKVGNGILVISGDNSAGAGGYTGTTTINQGVVRFGSANSIGGAGASVTAIGNGTAAADYAIDQAFLGRITGGSTGAVALGVDSANALDFSAAGANLPSVKLGAALGTSVTYSGALTPYGTTYRLGGGGGNLTVSQALSGGNDLVIADAALDTGIAGGIVILPVANSHTGTTTVTGNSTLVIKNALGLGTTAGGTTVGGNKAALHLDGGFTVTGETLLLAPSNGTATLRSISGNNVWGGDITVTRTGNLSEPDATFSAATGTSLTINGGINVTTSAGTENVRLDPNSGTVTVTGVVSGATQVSLGGQGTAVLSNLNTYTGPTSIGIAILSINSIKNVGGGPSAIGDPVTVANGTINISASNQQGTLLYTGGDATTDRVIKVNSGNSNNGAKLEQAGTGLLKFTSDLADGATSGPRSKTLTLQGSTAGVGEFAGAIANTAFTNFAVTKSGTGTWILSGANTYSGLTTISTGTLLYNGSLNAGANGVTVANTATLGGTGVINRAVTVAAGGHVAPGASVETLEVASLDMAAGSFFDYEFANTSIYDQTLVAGALTLPTSGATVKFNLYVENTLNAWDFNGTYNLIVYSSLTNTFDDAMLEVINPVDGVTYTFQTANVDGIDYVQLVIAGGQNVPEPATLGLLALGGLAMAGAARRRRKM